MSKHDKAVEKFHHSVGSAKDLEGRVKAALKHSTDALRELAAEILEAADHADANQNVIAKQIIGK